MPAGGDTPTNPTPFQPKGLDHVVLRVVDAARMTAFYRDVLGCPVERDEQAIGLVQLRAGRSLIDRVDAAGLPSPKRSSGFAQAGEIGRGAAPRRDGRNMDHLCLRIEPFEEGAIRAHLERHGVSAGEIKRRYGAEGYGPSLYIEDPEGNTVELKGPPEG